jgi:hypothetical protein
MKGTVLAHERTTFQGKRAGENRVGVSASGRVGVKAEDSSARIRNRPLIVAGGKRETRTIKEGKSPLPHPYAPTPIRLPPGSTIFPLLN